MREYKKQPETIDELYMHHCSPPEGEEFISSDIKDHLPTLVDFAARFDTRNIVELGVRWVVSTLAFAVARPHLLFCVDLEHPDDTQWADRAMGKMDMMKKFAESEDIDFRFFKGDSRKVDVDIACDLLFIDTLHDYAQLKAEFKHWEPKCHKWIIIHDTESFKTKDESTGKGKGTWKAIEEFVSESDWEFYCHYFYNNGLTVLKHKDYNANRVHDWELGQMKGDEATPNTREDHK